MANIKGITLNLKVGSEEWSPTYDPLYLGVYSKTGGREFGLDVEGYEEYDSQNKIVKLKLGEGCCSSQDDLQVRYSLAESNAPLNEQLDINSISFVYLRKGLLQNETSDNLLVLDSADILFCDDDENYRRFTKSTKMYFGYECGGQHWLKENSMIPGCEIVVKLEKVVYTGDDIGDDMDFGLSSSIENSIPTLESVPLFYNHDIYGDFPHNSTKYWTAIKKYSIPGCCGGKYSILLRGYAIENDPAPIAIDDTGGGFGSVNIECTPEQIIKPFEFSFEVSKTQRKKIGILTYHGKVIAKCTNIQNPS